MEESELLFILLSSSDPAAVVPNETAQANTTIEDNDGKKMELLLGEKHIV